jgi:hypothetical protein
MKRRTRATIPRWVQGFISCLLCCGLCAGLVKPARANPGNGDVDKADRLFAEGKALLVSDLQQACEKFDESLHYNPAAIGTLLNVALCDERFGRVASAVAKFTDARTRATEQGLLQHKRAAEEHIAALEPSVPHLAIKLTEPIAAIQIVIDDRVVAPDASKDVAVDPGERVIVVTAPGRRPFRSKLVINKFEHREVVVPPLEASLVVRGSQRRIGQISTVAGGIAIATGIGIGVYARNLHLSAYGHPHVPGDGLCNERNICEPIGAARNERARTLGNVGTVVGLIGVVTASVGAYLWYRSPRSTSQPSDQRLTVAPSVGPEVFTISASGQF